MQRLLPVGTRVQLSDVKQFYICGYLSGSKEHNIEYIGVKDLLLTRFLDQPIEGEVFYDSLMRETVQLRNGEDFAFFPQESIEKITEQANEYTSLMPKFNYSELEKQVPISFIVRYGREYLKQRDQGEILGGRGSK